MANLHINNNCGWKSVDFILKIKDILNAQGIDMNYGVNKNKTYNDLPYIRTSKMENIEKFYNYIYENSNDTNRLERKYFKFNELLATSNGNVTFKTS